MPRRDSRSLTFLDRHGPDGAIILRATGMGAVVGAITTALVATASPVPPAPPHSMLRALAAGLAAGTAMYAALRAASEGAGAGFLAFVPPGGIPAEPEYARLEALAARGDISAALRGYEQVIAAHPGESVARLRAAELHIRTGGLRRAEALLQEIQRQPARTVSHDLRASNRLVDLYLGPLDEPGKALRELRRIADDHEGTPTGDGAAEAIAQLEAAV